MPGPNGWNPAATGAGRIDGPAKVTGSKLYASDFRAADLPGWPPNTSHALLIRATDATHVFTGVDLSRLSGALKPSRVVTAADLAGAGIRVPAFFEGDLFCPAGKTPLYLGQPLVMLIFEQFDAFDQARLALREPVLRELWRGDRSGRDCALRLASFRAGCRRDAGGAGCLFAGAGRLDRAAQFRQWRRSGLGAGRSARAGGRASLVLRRTDPRRTCGGQSGPAGARPRIRDAIRRSDVSRAGKRARLVQRPTPKRLSSCSACSRLTRPRKRSPICWATRGLLSSRRISRRCLPIWAAASADAIIRSCRFISRWPRCSFPIGRCGSRSTATNSFNRGIKRHAFKIHTRIGIDRATGKISGFAADHVLDGGGLANFSNNVSTVSAIAALGIYDVPKVDIATVALHSRGVTAGSMRGYGTLQTMTALEVLIDEAAAALPLDPIEFRRRNALKSGGRIMTGNTYSVSVRTPEILDKIEQHPIWQQRSAGESARAAGRSRRRHRRRLRHQELRQRRGLCAELGGNRCAGPDRHPLRSCRYGQRHRHGAGQSGGGCI